MRDNRLDVIRGLAILLLTLTHTVPGRSLLESTGHYYIILGWFFHGADVFVAFSGLVCGMVYRRLYERNGSEFLIRKGIARALQLFCYNAAAFCVVAVVVLMFRQLGTEAPVHRFDRPITDATIGTIFLYQPIEYFNILNVYIVLLIILPFFVIAQSRTNLPVWGSALLYLGYQAARMSGIFPGDSNTFFIAPLAWQFLFFGGVALGMNYQHVRANLPPLRRTIGPIMLYFLVTHFMREQAWIVHRFAAKFDLGFLRIIDLVLVCYVVDRLVRPDVPITSPALRRIASIGSNSLFCFSITLVLCYVSSGFLAAVNGGRAIYLVVLLTEVFVMLAIGQILLDHPSVRSAIQIRWVERLIMRKTSEPKQTSN